MTIAISAPSGSLTHATYLIHQLQLGSADKRLSVIEEGVRRAAVVLLSRPPRTGRLKAQEGLDMVGKVGTDDLMSGLEVEEPYQPGQVREVPQLPPGMLIQFEPRLGGRDASKGNERLVDLEFGRLHCLPDLLRAKLLFALALNADAVPVWLDNQDIEATLVIALTAQLADLGPGVAALHKVGDNALELLGRQTLEGQHRRQRPQRRRVVDGAVGSTRRRGRRCRPTAAAVSSAASRFRTSASFAISRGRGRERPCSHRLTVCWLTSSRPPAPPG